MAAGRNGGQILNCLGEFSYTDLLREHGKGFADDFLNRARDVMADIAHRPGVDWRGGATTLAGNAEQAAHLNSLAAHLSDAGYGTRFHHDSCKYFDGFVGAFSDPHSGCVDPYRLIQSEAQDFTDAGGVIAEQSPVHHIDENQGQYHIHCPNGVVRAPHVIVTAGSGLQNLVRHGCMLDTLKKPAPPIIARINRAVMNVGTMMLVTEPLPPALAAPFGRSGCFLTCSETCDYFHLNSENRLSFGSFNFFEGTASPSAAFLVEKIKPYSPELYRAIQGRKIGISHFWTGYDTATADVEPLVRQSFAGPDATPNQSLSIITGGNGAGNTGMRVIGDWVADHLVRRLTHNPTDPNFEILATAPIRAFPGGILAPLGTAAYAWTQQIANDTLFADGANYLRHRVFKL